MKKILIVLIIIANLTNSGLVFAQEAQDPKITSTIVADVKNGEKVDISQTVNLDNLDEDRYVLFVNKGKYEQEKKTVAKSGGVFSNVDDSNYGKVKALPLDLSHMKDQQKEDFLLKMNTSNDVIAISKVQKRTFNALPNFNDPLFPTDTTYTNAKQWNLSQPANGNYGIDLLRAWQSLDTAGKVYNGNSNIVVAVLDTGAAFENYSKYSSFPLMSSPTAWVFSKASDFTSNNYLNSDETANNQIDDDANADPDFCLDRNQDGDCDAGELASFIDDRNSLNIVDWGRYWSRVDYTELTSAPICTNEPYLSQEVRCVSDTLLDSVCDLAGQTNDMYHGCYATDMGHANDTNGHGTLVSNIISATPNNGISGVGIASGVTLLNIKIFGEYYSSYRSKWIYDSAYGDQIASAINYAVDAGAKIINMSFAGGSIDLYEKMAMDKAFYEDGVLLIASSGNSASSTAMYPAGYDSVFSVGASTKTGARASYSSYGTTVDMSAPVDSSIVTQGMWDVVNNRSLSTPCSWDGSLSCMNIDPIASPSQFSTFFNLNIAGTSFASPQVVGVAALVMSKYPNLTATQVQYILKMSSLPNGSAASNTSIGHGVLNAYNAVEAKDYRGINLDIIKRMYQTHITTTGYIQTRYSDVYGAKWSNWVTSGNVKSVGNIKMHSMPLNTSRNLQIMKGSNSGVYVRYADNFGYLSVNDSLWTGWHLLGYTFGAITTEVSGNNVVIVWKGTDGKTYTKYSADGHNWNSAAISTQPVVSNVTMIHDSVHNKLVQLIRSTGNYVYVRNSPDNGVNWSGWVRSYDIASIDPIVNVIDGRLIRTVKQSDGLIITRYTEDGGINWSTRNRTYGTTGLSVSNVAITEIAQSNVILQTYRTASGDIYTRRSTDNGANWSTQIIGIDIPAGIKSVVNPAIVVSGTNVLQFIKGSDSYLYTRVSTNSGSSWGAWSKTGSIKIIGNISPSVESNMNRVYLNVRGIDGKIYSRYSDNGGVTFSTWQIGVSTLQSVSNYSVEIANMDLSN